MDTDISVDIHVKSVDMDLDVKFHNHGKPGLQSKAKFISMQFI